MTDLKYLIVTILLASSACSKSDNHYNTWCIKGGTADGIQYSALDQINKANVSQLQPIWVYQAGDADTITNRTQIQCNSIIVNGVLYGTSPSLKAFAINASTGKEIWKFTPPGENTNLGTNRGVTYWEDSKDKRILYCFGEYLYALNALTGKEIKNFGTNGRISLKLGLGDRSKNLMVLSNTPGVIYKNLIIMGSRVHEGPLAAPGHIRAFNVETGQLVWTFHTIPQPNEEGYNTWPPDAWNKVGGANCWSGMTVDHERGLVFASTGSASFDFYGGNRKGKNLFANCVLALDAETGKRKWHFQTTHHDLWDRDLPTAPILVTVNRNGNDIDAVAQVTKQGFTFLFDRDTGETLFPIEEREVPASDLDGEIAWPTQPTPLKPAPFARQTFTSELINNLNPNDESYLKEKFKKLRTGNFYTPPSKEGTIIFPGFDGGAEWGGPSFDPESGVLFVNSNEMPWILTMVDVRTGSDTTLGHSLFQTYCATCHGSDRKGDMQHIYPSLENINLKLNENSLSKLIQKGRGLMPSFAALGDDQRNAIVRYLLNMGDNTKQKIGFFERQSEILFSNTGYNRFLTPEGYPAVKPPWGTLNAIDLNTGNIKWQVPLGEFEELKKKGIPPTGTENYGGSVVTKGGLIFIAASSDKKFRAFDKNTGRILWEYMLPAGGYATPSIYEIGGKEFIVIACGGGKMGTKSGDNYIAFSL